MLKGGRGLNSYKHSCPIFTPCINGLELMLFIGLHIMPASMLIDKARLPGDFRLLALSCKCSCIHHETLEVGMPRHLHSFQPSGLHCCIVRALLLERFSLFSLPRKSRILAISRTVCRPFACKDSRSAISCNAAASACVGSWQRACVILATCTQTR